MPPIRNYCVARGSISSSGFVSLYVVPDSNAFILKTVHLVNSPNAVNTLHLYLRDAAGSVLIEFFNESVQGSSFATWSGWTVLNAADQLYFNSSGAPTEYWVAGALLPFVPGF